MKQNISFILPRFDLSLLPVFFINIALIFYPATVLLVPKMNGLIFGLLVLTGIVFVIRQRQISFKVNHEEKLFYLSIGVFFFAALLITVNAGFVYKAIGKYLHLLLAIPVYIYLRHIGVRLVYLWYGLVVGSIVTAGIAIYDVYLTDTPRLWGNVGIRAMGITHPIVFGDLALVMGCMSMAGFGWFKQRASWQVLFPVVALLCGVLASILSLSRGSWVTVPFLLIVFFWYIQSSFSFHFKAAMAAAAVFFFTAIYMIPQTGVSYQVDRTQQSLQQYSDSEITSGKRATSVGTRLEMWQASWAIFLENPILGVGWGHYKEEAQKQVDQGLRNRSAVSFAHPHSQYFTALASGGLLGFVVTLALFLVPAWLFVRYIKNKESDEISQLALAGLLLIVGYMGFSISEPLLDRSRSVNFFAFYLVVFMAAIQGQQRVGLAEDSGK